MRCGKCGKDNRDGRRFCAECGAVLAVKCAQCGASNEPDEKFCGACGASLAAGSGAAPANQAPPPGPGRGALINIVAEPAIGDPPDGERKTVTALFADIKGSTEMMEDLDPEKARAIIDPALRLMMDAVHWYDGYVVCKPTTGSTSPICSRNPSGSCGTTGVRLGRGAFSRTGRRHLDGNGSRPTRSSLR